MALIRPLVLRPSKTSVTILILAILTVMSSCSNDNPQASSKSEEMDGFTFFGLGQNSLLSDLVRDNLEDHLGSEAITARSTIDLSIPPLNFLKDNFPHLYALNKELNWPPNERVEHNITKLMYRYATRNELPFDYVELFFSNFSQKPLFFRIHANSKGDFTMNTLKKKYGPPQQIKRPDKDFQTLFWRKEKDVLIASLIKDRFDRPEYLFCIFYAKNIENLVQREKIERKDKVKKIEDAGKTAF
jgi:hypothetical protein